MKKLLLIFICQFAFSQNKILEDENFTSSWVRPALGFFVLDFEPEILNSQSSMNSVEDIEESFNELKDGFKDLFTKGVQGKGKLKISNFVVPRSFLNDFDLFNLEINESSMKVNDYSSKYVNEIVSKISGRFISSIFNEEDGKVNYDKIQDRALNSLTEELRNQYDNSLRGIETSSKDYLTQQVLNQNYIIVLENYYTKTRWYVYRVHIGEGINIDERISSWYDIFDGKFDLMKESRFPISLLDSGVFKSQENQFSTVEKSIKKIRSKIPRFRMRSRILDDLTISIGDKEKIKIDDKFISYIEVENENGEIVKLKKKGIDRVKSVGVNSNLNLIKTSESSVRTKLYPDGGSNSSKGMISIKKKEVGVGISYFLSENYGWRVDYRTKWWPNFFLYLEGEDWRGNQSIWGENAEATTFHFGIQQTFKILRNLNSSIFLGVGGSDNIYSDDGTFKYSISEDKFIKIPTLDDTIGFIENKELISQEDSSLNVVTLGLSVGFKLFSFQMIPTVRYILRSPDGFYDDQFQYGGSVRINF